MHREFTVKWSAKMNEGQIIALLDPKIWVGRGRSLDKRWEESPDRWEGHPEIRGGLITCELGGEELLLGLQVQRVQSQFCVLNAPGLLSVPLLPQRAGGSWG